MPFGYFGKLRWGWYSLNSVQLYTSPKSSLDWDRSGANLGLPVLLA